MLGDIEGDSPRVQFSVVLRGAEEAYNGVQSYLKHIIPGGSTNNLSFEDSDFLHHVNNLRGYALNHIVDSDFDSARDQLSESVDVVYTLWKWSIERTCNFGQSQDISKGYRYFSLFAQGAFLRLALDFNMFTDIHYGVDRQKEYSSGKIVNKLKNLETYFSPLDLLLLASIEIKDPAKSFEYSLKGPLRSLQERYCEDINKDYTLTHMPKAREFDYYRKGRSPTPIKKVVSRENAIEWLSIPESGFQFTKFL